MTIHFDNSYARLPGRFYVRQPPAAVPAPELFALNDRLGERLGLVPARLRDMVDVFAGNRVPEGADPLAQAYAGHQFGGWVPQLGDGRAVLLGEVLAPDGARFDIALKGSGKTPFSRRGDGRAWLGPVMREYLVSEAMHALGVPTTRALAAVTTGETVWRETALPGAVLTRVAASHIRVGTFQYFAARGDVEALGRLTDHVIARHYPDADGPLALLGAVMERQARLVAHWMALGFIHGVMNTDNMAISGETIDYGPCAFMDAFDPARIFSSIDQHGRYAYRNQPNIALWNLAQLASCLLPLMGDEAAAIESLSGVLNRFPDIHEGAWLTHFAAKIGISAPEPADGLLADELLTLMAAGQADFTRTFRGLVNGRAADEFADPAPFRSWERRWKARITGEPSPETVMARANPALIARNHRVEEAIGAAVAGDFSQFGRLNAALAQPFEDRAEDHDLTLAPSLDDVVLRTFCGT